MILRNFTINFRKAESKFWISYAEIFGMMMMESDDFIEDYIKEHYKVYDRFTFDFLFKRLLKDGYDHKEAKDIITYNCALSTLVLQERIHNDYYLEINKDDKISEDLLELKNEIYVKYFFKNNN